MEQMVITAVFSLPFFFLAAVALWVLSRSAGWGSVRQSWSRARTRHRLEH